MFHFFFFALADRWQMVLHDFLLPICDLPISHFIFLFQVDVVYIHPGVVVKIAHSELVKLFSKRFMFMAA